MRRHQAFALVPALVSPKQAVQLSWNRSSVRPCVQAACDKIVAAATATGAKIGGPVPLPTKRRIYCVLRSPHVNKDSREHFEVGLLRASLHFPSCVELRHHPAVTPRMLCYSSHLLTC